MSALDAIYAKIPDAGCKGLCVDACGPIICSPSERAEIQKWTGEDIMEWTKAIGLEAFRVDPCRFLLAGRCSIYSMRPAICRLFGVVDNRMLKCPHGCRPPRLLSDGAARTILTECEEAGEKP